MRSIHTSLYVFLEEISNLLLEDFLEGWEINALLDIAGISDVPKLPDKVRIKAEAYPNLSGLISSAIRRVPEQMRHMPVGKYLHEIQEMSRSASNVATSSATTKKIFEGPLLTSLLPPENGPGSKAHWEALMPKTPIDDKSDYEFVMHLLGIRSTCEPYQQQIYGYQFDRLSCIIRGDVPGYRKATRKYRLDSVENIDDYLQRARNAVKDSIPKLKAVKSGEE